MSYTNKQLFFILLQYYNSPMSKFIMPWHFYDEMMIDQQPVA